MINLSIIKYLKKVYFNIIIVSITAAIFPLISAYYIDKSFINFILISLIAVICTFTSIYFIGCNYQERQFIHQKLNAIKSKITRK